jgi:hypothetical protein
MASACSSSTLQLIPRSYPLACLCTIGNVSFPSYRIAAGIANDDAPLRR